MPVTAWNVLTALVPMTLHPDRFDSVSHQFGPVFLLFLPALFLEKRPRRVIAVAALGYAFLMICVSQRQSMRFVLIALGPMSVGVAWLANFVAVDLPTALGLGVWPFLIGDALKIALAAGLLPAAWKLAGERPVS